ncbi:MAG: oligoendopeptidase F [Planctomycetia bacterium]|nr:oligoendopeptidase F [Planctomycetia bacterium]
MLFLNSENKEFGRYFANEEGNFSDYSGRDRSDVPKEDTWDLSKLFRSDKAWEQEQESWKAAIDQFEQYRGKLADPKILAEFFEREGEFDKRANRLYLYAYLKSSEDVAQSKYSGYKNMMASALAQAGAQTSFVRPELLALSQEQWNKLLKDPCLKDYRLVLERIRRFKTHTLSKKEEKLLALSSEIAQSPQQIFYVLNNAELKFDSVRDENGNLRPLTQETFSVFLHSAKRSVRKEAFEKFYRGYESFANTISASLEGSIKKDVFYAKSRNYPNSLEMALFSEEIPYEVYSNLIEEVHAALPDLYRYYEIRRKKMRIKEIHFYDTYVPVVHSVKFHHTWEQAVDLIMKALQPMGKEYLRLLSKGLLRDRWADRYENKNKASGAYSFSAYQTIPYIMINYKEELLESVFTLIHESGHSMHSWYSSRTQPFQYSDYEIFLAEIASTFNEQMLARFLLDKADDPKIRFWIINREIDSIRATIFRQTMFSEFEKKTHELAEKQIPLTKDRFQMIYRELLELYFGPRFALDEALSLECLRIPHFYRGFYVYKYATGLSAAIALADRVRNGGEKERKEYFELLCGGSSDAPLEILKKAGVDMLAPDTIRNAMRRFSELIDEFEKFKDL